MENNKITDDALFELAAEVGFIFGYINGRPNSEGNNTYIWFESNIKDNKSNFGIQLALKKDETGDELRYRGLVSFLQFAINSATLLEGPKRKKNGRVDQSGESDSSRTDTGGDK